MHERLQKEPFKYVSRSHFKNRVNEEKGNRGSIFISHDHIKTAGNEAKESIGVISYVLN